MSDFKQMLSDAIWLKRVRQNVAAPGIGCSNAMLSELLKGTRLPSPGMVNKICDYLKTSKADRKKWHLAAAKAHGFEV